MRGCELLLGSLLLLGACDGATKASSDGDTPLGAMEYGLHYTGEVRAEHAALSAPILPDARAFQHFQFAGPYAALTTDERVALVDDHTYLYAWLLTSCAATHPAITLTAAGDPALDAATLRTNYDEVARCAYETYGAKPYWVPQQMSDLDVCARKLGADWKLPSASDVRGFSEHALQRFRSTLSVANDLGSFPAYFYYSLRIYVRADDGTVAEADLATSPVIVQPVEGPLDALHVGDTNKLNVRCVPIVTPS